MATKWVYMFKEGNATMRNLLGGKGANLFRFRRDSLLQQKLVHSTMRTEDRSTTRS